MSDTGPLVQLLQERCGKRFFRVFAEQVETQKNFYSQLESIERKEVVIEGKRLLNFNAIDYLGLDTDPRMIRAAQLAVARWGTHAGLARAAAEMSLYEALEARICRFLGVDNAIVYNTVTLANHGVIPLLMRQDGLILVDVEAHSSVQRAAIEAKGGGAGLLSFHHDDFDQLERLLAANRAKYRHVMIALDGVYSMLGTYLDLPRYAEMAEKYDAFLFVDDAHGFGVVGPGGRGIVNHYGHTFDNIVYVGSLEKSLSSLGGFVVVPRRSRNLFRYNSYTYVFSGQLPAACLGSALAALDILETEGPILLKRLYGMIRRVKAELQQMGFELIGEDQPFPLILVKAGDVLSVGRISQFFFDRGIHILTVGFPVIPMSRGALVRISLSAIHTDAQIQRLLETFRKLRSVLPSQPHVPGHAHVSLACEAGPIASGQEVVS